MTMWEFVTPLPDFAGVVRPLFQPWDTIAYEVVLLNPLVKVAQILPSVRKAGN